MFCLARRIITDVKNSGSMLFYEPNLTTPAARRRCSKTRSAARRHEPSPGTSSPQEMRIRFAGRQLPVTGHASTASLVFIPCVG